MSKRNSYKFYYVLFKNNFKSSKNKTSNKWLQIGREPLLTQVSAMMILDRMKDFLETDIVIVNAYNIKEAKLRAKSIDTKKISEDVTYISRAGCIRI